MISHTQPTKQKPEMFRFAANAHGWPMRVVEHRPVACVPSPENIRDSPLPPISGLQTRWAHRLKVYVPLTWAYRRKHPMFITAPKITSNVLRHLNITEGTMNGAGKPNSYSTFNASRTTAPVRSMSPVECAVEMKPVSNCDGAKYTPRFKQS